MTAYHYKPATGDQRIDGILHGDAWNVTNLTFQFPNSVTYYYSSGYQNFPSSYFQVTLDMANVIRYATDSIASFTNLSFTEIAPGSGFSDMNFAVTDAFTDPDGTPYNNGTALGFFPNMTAGGDIWFNPFQFGAPTYGDYAYATAFHELGHGLGLKHPHDPGGSLGGSNFGTLPLAVDTIEFSMMSYKSYFGTTQTGSYATAGNNFAQTYMMLDIAALQYLYGADFSDTTNNLYSWTTSEGVIFGTIWDGGGVDTYDFSAFSSNQDIDLRPGMYSNTNSGQSANLSGSAENPPVYARGNVFNAMQFQGDVRSLIENAIGGSGADTISGNGAANSITGGGGNDYLYGLALGDSLYGGADDDRIYGGSGFDFAYGGGGNDYFYGGDNGGNLYGAAGDDRAYTYGAFNSEHFYGGSGDDRVYNYGGLSAQDDFFGGGGTDIIYFYGGSEALFINLGTGSANNRYGGFANALDLTSFEHVYGGDYGDSIVGSSGANRLYGKDGNDVLVSGGGNDTLYGGDDHDDFYAGAGTNTIYGGAGYDELFLANGGNSNTFNGGSGDDDKVTAQNSGAVWSINLTTGSATSGSTNVTLVNVNDARGGSANDAIIGNAAGNLLQGDAGNDFVSGEGGNDTIYGQDGDDVLRGGAGADALYGGAGQDAANYYSSSNGLTASLGNAAINTGHAAGDTYAGIENLVGTNKSDKLYGDTDANRIVSLGGSDSVYGGGGNDVVNGGGGNDTINGGGGNDIVVGGTGNDVVVGSSGNDTLYGGAGQDELSGQTGRDVMYGGGGSDVFDFNAISHSQAGATHDVIKDFSHTQGDKIDLATIDANSAAGGNQAFTYIGMSGFSNTAGELRFTTGGGNGFLAADVNGDGVADMTIEVEGYSFWGGAYMIL